jgi:hypothetical protein
LEAAGLAVWTPQSPHASNGQVYDDAVCLIIDMPKSAGIELLRLFRFYDIRTPALLIMDREHMADPETIDCGWVMDVVARGENPLRILRWIQSMCAAKHALSRFNRPEERLSA